MSSTPDSLTRVRDHFERDAERFDAIYNDEMPLHQRVVDRMWRGVVYERFRLIVNLAPLAGDWTVLDVGCGGGRYSAALAAAGASRVLGIDTAENMITLAREQAAAAGFDDRCEFVTSDFLSFRTDERFNIGVATGYFDYMDDPVTHLRRILELTTTRIFASFPKRWEVRVPLRKARFALTGGFVRFYDRGEVLDVYRQAGVPEDALSLIDLGRDWIAVSRKLS